MVIFLIFLHRHFFHQVLGAADACALEYYCI